jgi:hypothetical protein
MPIYTLKQVIFFFMLYFIQSSRVKTKFQQRGIKE